MFVMTTVNHQGERDIDVIYTGEKWNHWNSFKKLISDIIKTHEDSTGNKDWFTLSLCCAGGSDFEVLLEKTKDKSIKIYINGSLEGYSNGY